MIQPLHSMKGGNYEYRGWEIMPVAFERCVKNGGKVRTVKLDGGRYYHICILNKKIYKGEIKHKEKEKK